MHQRFSIITCNSAQFMDDHHLAKLSACRRRRYLMWCMLFGVIICWILSRSIVEFLFPPLFLYRPNFLVAHLPLNPNLIIVGPLSVCNIVGPPSWGIIIGPSSVHNIIRPLSWGIIVGPLYWGIVDGPSAVRNVIGPSSQGIIVKPSSRGIVDGQSSVCNVIGPLSRGIIVGLLSRGKVVGT